MSWPAVKRNYTQEQFRHHVTGLRWNAWRPSLIVLHNTAAPTLKQWQDSAAKDRAIGRIPGMSRIESLERYFEVDQHWSGCPHLFVADDFIWEMNRLTDPGVHSPSWNHLAIGIEMVADFDTEDDDTGAGLKVRQSTIFVTAVLCATLGLDPRAAIKLHKEDPRTTHACPGIDFARDRAAVIAEIEGLMPGGDLADHHVTVPIGTTKPPVRPEGMGTVLIADLNLRRGPDVTTQSMGLLPLGLKITVLDVASNGTTTWLKIRTPFGAVGWVAGGYVALSK